MLLEPIAKFCQCCQCCQCWGYSFLHRLPMSTSDSSLNCESDWRNFSTNQPSARSIEYGISLTRQISWPWLQYWFFVPVGFSRPYRNIFHPVVSMFLFRNMHSSRSHTFPELTSQKSKMFKGIVTSTFKEDQKKTPLKSNWRSWNQRCLAYSSHTLCSRPFIHTLDITKSEIRTIEIRNREVKSLKHATDCSELHLIAVLLANLSQFPATRQG